MMKPFTFRAVTLSLLFTFWYVTGGCGRAVDEHEPLLDVGPFESYVLDFEKAAKAAGQELIVSDLRIRFGKMDSPYEHGICEIIPGQTPTITLREAAWQLLSEEERQSLLFHEMGHCVLRRKHLSARNTRGLPLSLMYPYMIDRVTFAEYEKEYMTELFSGRGEF